MDDDWCCKGTDPSCDGPQECANRAALLIEAQQAEIERLRAENEDFKRGINWHTECLNCPKLMDTNYAQYSEINVWREVGEVLDGYFDQMCRFDHHGYCQAHLMEEDRCSILVMRELLGKAS